MTDSRISPCTIKPRAVALYLLITLSSVLLGATVAEQGRAGSSSQVDQLTTAFKLLQLQLKQTTETAEHVQSILADLAQQQGDAAPAHGLPAEGVVSKEHDHKPIPTYGVVHQETIVVHKQGLFSRTLAQRSTSWADNFLMLCAIKADTVVTAMAVLTYQPGGLQNQFLLLADTTGKLYVFNTRGQLALEHDAGTLIQSITAAVKTQDQAMLVAGLANCTSLVLHVTLSNRHAHLHQQLLKDSIQLLPCPASPMTQPDPRTGAGDSPAANMETCWGGSMATAECNSGLDPGVVEVAHVGLLRAGAARQVVAALADGQVLVYRENGTLTGAGQSPEAIKALHIVGSSISMLTTHHLASARVFGGEVRLKLRQLEGLNGSIIAAAAFDGQNQQRAYAVSTDMQLMLLQVSDQGRRAVKVMSRVPLTLAPTGGPVHLTHARGYLFLAAPTGIAVFNTTGFNNRHAPRIVLAHPYPNVASDFAPEGVFGEASVLPPMAAAHGALVAVSLGDGVVGLFESKMPFKEPDLLPLHAMSRPLAILAMLLVGGWQYVRMKRRQEAQEPGKTPWPTDWGPGDASRFVEFPELPKSRMQLVPPAKAWRMQNASGGTAARPRLPARVEGPQQETSNELLLQNADNLSSAELDALIFKHRPYESHRL